MTAVHLVGMALLDIQPTILGRTTVHDATIFDFTRRDAVIDPDLRPDSPPAIRSDPAP